MRGVAGGNFVSLVSGFDGGKRLKGDDMGTDGVVEVGGSVTASFCCGVGILGLAFSKIGNKLALLSWAFGSVPADPNNGDVSNEKIGGADEAAGRLNILCGLGGTSSLVEVGRSSATALVGSGVVVAAAVVEG